MVIEHRETVGQGVQRAACQNGAASSSNAPSEGPVTAATLGRWGGDEVAYYDYEATCQLRDDVAR